MLRHLIGGRDLSGHGLVNTASHHSEEVEVYDRATEVEAIGGKLNELSNKAWLELAEAARPIESAPEAGRLALQQAVSVSPCS